MRIFICDDIHLRCTALKEHRQSLGHGELLQWENLPEYTITCWKCSLKSNKAAAAKSALLQYYSFSMETASAKVGGEYIDKLI